MTKVGLIGLGKWGSILYKKLDSFCDVKFTCRSKDTYLDKLDSVDWVVVSTPNQTHYEIVKDCLNAGKNVFCEKPLSGNLKDAKKMLVYMRNKKNFAFVNLQLRFHPNILKM